LAHLRLSGLHLKSKANEMAAGHLKSGFPQTCHNWLGVVTADLYKNSIWQPMLKDVVSTTITIIIGVIPAVVALWEIYLSRADGLDFWPTGTTLWKE
jgi:hypothetical protein